MRFFLLFFGFGANKQVLQASIILCVSLSKMVLVSYNLEVEIWVPSGLFYMRDINIVERALPHILCFKERYINITGRVTSIFKMYE